MTRSMVWALLLLVLGTASSALGADGSGDRAAQEDDSWKDIRFSGKKVDSSELEDSEPRQIIGKDELASVFAGKGLECKQGAIRAGYARASGFVFDDGVVPADEVIAEVKRRRVEGRLSCFFVESTEYDRAVFDGLANAIGTGSIAWNDPPAGDNAGADDRASEKDTP